MATKKKQVSDDQPSKPVSKPKTKAAVSKPVAAKSITNKPKVSEAKKALTKKVLRAQDTSDLKEQVSSAPQTTQAHETVAPWEDIPTPEKAVETVSNLPSLGMQGTEGSSASKSLTPTKPAAKTISIKEIFASKPPVNRENSLLRFIRKP